MVHDSYDTIMHNIISNIKNKNTKKKKKKNYDKDGYLKPICCPSGDGNVDRILFTTQLGKVIQIFLPSHPQHQYVNCQ